MSSLVPSGFPYAFHTASGNMSRPEIIMIKIKRAELFAAVPGSYLTEHLPDTFGEIVSEEQDEMIQERLWEPFEDWDVSDVFELIEDSTTYIANFLKDKGVEVVE